MARSDLLGAKLTMETNFPEEENATLSLQLDRPREFTLHVRRPQWATGDYRVQVNGAPLPAGELPGAGGYASIKRSWLSGDKVSIALPRSLRLEPLPDNPARVAFMQGPLVLAADLGDAPRGRRNGPAADAAPLPRIAAAPGTAAEQILKAAGKPNTFAAATSAEPLTFAPFYTLSNRRYGIYWDLTPPRIAEGLVFAVSVDRTALQAGSRPRSCAAVNGPGDAIRRRALSTWPKMFHNRTPRTRPSRT
jgi:DUF1680 family protein